VSKDASMMRSSSTALNFNAVAKRLAGALSQNITMASNDCNSTHKNEQVS